MWGQTHKEKIFLKNYEIVIIVKVHEGNYEENIKKEKYIKKEKICRYNKKNRDSFFDASIIIYVEGNHWLIYQL